MSVAATGTNPELSRLQRVLWASQRLHHDAPLQNMVMLSHLDTDIEPRRFGEAFAKVVAGSDVLCHRIVEHAGEPVPRPNGDTVTTEVVDVERHRAEAWARDRARAPIDIATVGHDCVLLRHEDHTWSWYLGMHHAVCDATSSSLTFEAVAEAYFGGTPDTTSYYRWAAGIAGREDKRTLDARRHWTERRPGAGVGGLYKSVSRRTPSNTRVEIPLDDGLIAMATERFRNDLAMLSDDLAWTVLLATVAATHAHRLTNTTEFTFGLPVHGRSEPAARTVLGPTMEVFPVDVSIEPDDTARSLHRRVGRAVLDTLRYAVPGTSPSASDYETVVNVVSRARFPQFGQVRSTTRWIHPGASDPQQLVQLQLSMFSSSELCLEVDLNHAGIDKIHIDAAPSHLGNILYSILDDPDKALAAIPLLESEELDTLKSWGIGQDLEPRERHFMVELESVLLSTPEVVIEHGSTELTGPQTWNRIERVAAWLRSSGVGRGQRVGINMSRSTDAVIAIMATLLAGGSYLPLDPGQPARRRKSLAETAGCRLVLNEVPRLVELPGPDPGIGSGDRRDDDESYVMFTSGSTGEAKGVPISDAGLGNYLSFACAHYVDPAVKPVAPLFSALTFDLTVTSLFVPLLAGGKLVIIEESGLAGLRRVAARDDLTWMKATPSHLDILLKLGPLSTALSTLVVGGEALASRLVEQIFTKFADVAVYNEYGPTEAVVGCMIHEPARGGVRDHADVPIGGPAPGVDLLILDPNCRLVPHGAIGELYISHAGLTNGYLGGGNSRADGHHHQEDPFVMIEGSRYYRSGDLVRLVDDGDLMYLGRADDQMKVGGIRLEPSEVEHALAEHDNIARAAVRMWQPDGSRSSDRGAPARLVAWVEPAHGAQMPTRAELRSFLASRVATYAVPAAFVGVDALPLTQNGKLDEHALPSPAVSHVGAEMATVEPVGLLESQIVDTYQEVLGAPNVSAADDFFELGGDSLAALQLTMKLSLMLGVTLRDDACFAAPTPIDLAADIESGGAVAKAHESSGPGSRAPGETPGLSDGEAALLFEHLNEPGNPRYNVGRAYIVDGPIDQERLVNAVLETVGRHIPLRWTYSEPRVRLSAERALDVERMRGAVSVATFRERAVSRYLEPFDLEAGPLGRLLVCEIDDGTTGIATSFHHVSMYAGSFDKMWREIDAHYTDSEVADLGFDYAEHATWQQQRDRTDDSAYWSSPDQTREAANISLGTDATGDDAYIEKRASFSTEELRSGSGSTMFSSVLGGLAAMLRRRSDGDVIPIAITADIRDHPGAEHLIGYFLNTLPLLIETRVGETLQTITDRCGTVVAGALARRTYPFSSIVTDRRRAGLAEPSASILLAFEQHETPTLGGHRAAHEVLTSGHAVTDATFFVQLRGQEVQLGLEYRGAVLSNELAHVLLEDFDNVIRAAIDTPGSNVGDIELASITAPMVAEPPTGDPTRLLLDAIRARVADCPDAPAVVFGETTLTYAQLDERATSLVAILRAAGVKPRTFVAVEALRHADVVVAMLAIWKAGAAYVPIDPDYPPDHIDHVLRDAAVEVIVTGAGAERHKYPNSITAVAATTADASPVTSHDRDDGATGRAEDTESTPGPTPRDPAYMIYTSGSTGRPKGVAVTHSNIAYSTLVRSQVYGAPVGRFLVLSSFAFDSSMVGLWWTLCDGGTVVLPEPGQQRDVWEIAALIERHEVSHMLGLPSLYRLLLDETSAAKLASLTTVIVAGEPCSRAVASKHHSIGIGAALYNEYGPTEATVWSHFHRVDTELARGQVPIGSPVPGTTSVVVDSSDQPVATGVPGELLVSGPTVTPGYHGDPGLTAQRFVKLGKSQGVDPSIRWYRTGDIVEVRSDSNLVFRGRIDDQVKIRGFRVELGDIEAAAITVDAVTDAVVAIVPGSDAHSGGDRLAIWYLTVDDTNPGQVRDALRARLPDHMIPSLYAQLREFPLTPNGKVDRSALPPAHPIAADAPAQTRGPSPKEAALVSVWAEVLGVDDVAVHDNFFDLGGDSIVSIQVVSRLRKLGYRLTPRDVFTYQTIAELAGAIDQVPMYEAEQGPVSGEVPLTPIQRWFFGQDLAEPNHWNQSLWVEVAVDTDLVLLEQSLEALTDHHDMLRARFERTADDSGRRQVLTTSGRRVRFENHANLGPNSLAAAVGDIDASLDIERGDLMAVATFASEQRLDLYITVHHLVMDAVSWSPLLDDWATIYQQLASRQVVGLQAKTTSFKAWAKGLLDRANDRQAAGFWENQPPPVLHDRPSNNTEGLSEVTSATADVQATADLLATGNVQNILIGSSAIAACEALGVDAVDLMLEGHGREEQLVEHADLSRTVGWFTSRYPLHIDSSADPETSVFARVDGLMAAIPDSGIGYGVARELAEVPALLDRSEPSVAFNYLGQLDRSLALSSPFVKAGELLGPISAENQRDHSLAVIASIRSGCLTVKIDHVPTHLSSAAATEMADRILQVCARLVSSGDAPRPDTGNDADPTFALVDLDSDQMSHLAEMLDRLDR